MLHRRTIARLLPACVTWFVLLASIRATAQTTAELKRMSLQDLLDIPVTTVSRVPEEVGDLPAAVFVITQEDIRRSGATSIPEVLRLAPGVEVARINSGTRSRGRLTPVLAVSAYASAEDRARSLRAGFQAHLAKPCGGIELVAAVADAVARV